MSMLAERRQKQKFTLNPRGKLWSEDSNKFGQKMLEKMGWSQGKGLGAKEDGIVEHVKQTFKNDATGIGYVDKGDQWTKHEVDFTSLLQSLGGDETDKSDAPRAQIELEKKSQTSKKRVHYHKFLREKDLSLKSEKDLAQIFGKKSLKETKREVVEVAEPSEKNFGVVTVNGGNMQDYFKTKFVGTLTIDRDSGDERPSFQMNDSFGFSGLQLESPVAKKKKKTKVVINECFDNGGFVDFDAETPGKKRKLETITEEAEIEETKRKRKSDDDPDSCRKKKPKKSEIDDSACAETTKKRKKSKKPSETTEETVKKQKKSKKTPITGIDNPMCLSTEIIDAVERPETTVTSNEVVRKKQKNRVVNDEEFVPVKKKKSKKTPVTDNGIDNPSCLSTEIIDAIDETATSNEVVRKKTKKIPVTDEIDDTVVRKKLKKRSIGIDNEACTATSIEQRIQETIASVSEAVDEYQLELENQINEGKEHEKKAEEIWTSLKPRRDFTVRKSVKQFIQGEVRCRFEGSNLLKLVGYGNNVQRR